MIEIELKAHVYDIQTTVNAINKFANYLGTVIKDDTYYHLQTDTQKAPLKKEHISCRIRHEIYTFADNSTKEQNVLTYKNNELKKNASGQTYEVNEENESELSCPQAVEKLLLDSGFSKAYTKHKDVKQWTFDTQYGQAHIELCNVPPLGHFLEIEIVTETCNNEIQIQNELKNLIVKSGVKLSDIEERYYWQLLAQIKT